MIVWFACINVGLFEAMYLKCLYTFFKYVFFVLDNILKTTEMLQNLFFNILETVPLLVIGP